MIRDIDRPQSWFDRVDLVEEVINDFLDSEVILDDEDYKGYDTTGVAKRIIAALGLTNV